MIELDKQEHLVLRCEREDLNSKNRKSPNYTEPFYMVVKDFKSLSNLVAEPNTSYYLLNSTTYDKVVKHRVTVPKRAFKRFIMLELEQHKGENKLEKVLTPEEIELLKSKHNKLMPEGFQTSDALFCYSTGGGVNLIYLNSDKNIKNITAKRRRIRKEINNKILDNIYDTTKTDGFYDGSYTLNTKFTKLRFPVKGSVNVKYGNEFKGVKMQAGAKEIDYLNLSVEVPQKEGTLFDEKIKKIYEEVRDEIITDKESKILTPTLHYLEDLGYTIDGLNTCIHVNHEDNKPSMFISRSGKAECRSGKADHHYFTVADLIRAKGGDVDKYNLQQYVSDNLKIHSNLIDKDTMRIVLRHIERKRVMIIGNNITDRSSVYNYNNGQWSVSDLNTILYEACTVMAEICKDTLARVHSLNFDEKELNKSSLLKLINRSTIVKKDGNFKILLETLILVINSNRALKRDCLYTTLPSEKDNTIPFLNGVYNTDTGMLEKEHPEHHILSRVGVNYRKFDDYSEIENLLDEWTGGEGLELAIGLARGLNRAESGKMLFLIGSGANGKSTLTTEIMGAVLNNNRESEDRASAISLKNLADTSGNNFMLYRLVGKSLNISSEIEKHHALLDTLKEKTGEGDVIQVNIKHKQPFEMKFTATLILSGNTMPYVPENNRALTRRIQLFEFKNDYKKILSEAKQREFKKHIKSKEFLEKFFSYLALVLTRYNRNEIQDQPEEVVIKRIRKYNDTIRTLIETDYVIEKNATADLGEFERRLLKLHSNIKQGSDWHENTIVDKLHAKGFLLDIHGNIKGLRLKTDDDTPNKPTKGSVFSQKLKEGNEKPVNEVTSSTTAPQEVLDKVDSILGEKLKNRKVVALDIETTGLIPSEHKVATIQIVEENGNEIFIETRLMKADIIREKLLKLLKHQAVIGHNITFDFGFLKEHYDIDVVRDDIYVLDTMIASKIDRQSLSIADELEQTKHMTKNDYKYTANGYTKDYSLKGIMKYYLNIEMDKTEQKSDWSKSLTDEQKEYAMNDVRHLHKLYNTIQEKITEREMGLVLKLEQNATQAIIEANTHTLKIDMDKGNKLVEKFQNNASVEVDKYNTIMKDIIAKFWETEEDMLNSFLRYKHAEKIKTDSEAILEKYTPAKMAKSINSLTDKDGVYISKSKGIFNYIMGLELEHSIESTDEKSIIALSEEHPIFPQILNMTKMLKELKDIKNALRYRTDEGRVITRLNQIGAVTGRMSSSALKDNKGKKAGINMQQINRDPEFRDLFGAGEGNKLVLADYSAMELRIVANIAKEDKMLQAFHNNEDLHTKTACLLHDLDYNEVIEVLKDHNHPKYAEYKGYRNGAKSVGFLTVYGGGAKALSENIGITEEQAKKLIDDYKNKAYPMLAQYITQQNGTKTVTTALGRKIDTESTLSMGALKSLAEWKQRQYKPRNNETLFTAPGYTTPVNFPIQGTGADIVKLALVLLINHEDYIADDVHITHIVHDEILLEVKENLASKWKTILQDKMELAGNIIVNNSVNMEAEPAIGNTWYEAK